MRVLFISPLGDSHASAIATALTAAEHECLFWDPSDFEHGKARIEIAAGRPQVSLTATGLDGAQRQVTDFTRADVLFIRRIPPIRSEHIQSEHGPNFVRNGRAHTSGILHTLSEHMTSVCSFQNVLRLENKPLQLMIAAECGFSVPQTCLTNDPKALRASFPREPDLQIIAKPLRNLDWLDAHGEQAALPVTRVEIDELDDTAIHAFPMIFQAEIMKQYEVRLVWIRGSYIAVRYQLKVPRTFVDSRSYRSDEYDYATLSLPEPVVEACRSYCERFNTKFAVFDFAVDEAGIWYFLESNAFGNFLGLQDFIEPRFVDLFVHQIPQLAAETDR